MLEVQGRHQRRHRCRRGLMTADLQPRGVRPDPIGVIDDRRRQPQHALLDLAQHGLAIHSQIRRHGAHPSSSLDLVI